MKTGDNFFESDFDWYEFEDYLINVNRCFLIPKWQKFIAGILSISQKRPYMLTSGSILFRARNGTEKSQVIGGEKGWKVCYWACEDMGAPPKAQATGGRVNPPGMSYLYLSDSVETAIAEIRPWMKAEITVGHMEVKTDRKLVDLTGYNPSLGAVQLAGAAYSPEDLVWNHINYAFAKPISRNEKNTAYIATQYLAQLFCSKGFNGVKYSSSLVSSGFNVCLFSSDDVIAKSREVYRIDEIKYSFKKLPSQNDYEEGSL